MQIDQPRLNSTNTTTKPTPTSQPVNPSNINNDRVFQVNESGRRTTAAATTAGPTQNPRKLKNLAPQPRQPRQADKSSDCNSTKLNIGPPTPPPHPNSPHETSMLVVDNGPIATTVSTSPTPKPNLNSSSNSKALKAGSVRSMTGDDELDEIEIRDDREGGRVGNERQEESSVSAKDLVRVKQEHEDSSPLGHHHVCTGMEGVD
ncbi:hypothetical protein HK102_011911, partial [Quaeritorhiza haematococci]